MCVCTSGRGEYGEQHSARLPKTLTSSAFFVQVVCRSSGVLMDKIDPVHDCNFLTNWAPNFPKAALSQGSHDLWKLGVDGNASVTVFVHLLLPFEDQNACRGPNKQRLFSLAIKPGKRTSTLTGGFKGKVHYNLV